MTPRHAVHPDLAQCVLEDRYLPAAPGLLPPQFLAPSGTNTGFIVAGLGQGDSFGNSGAFSFPGPAFFRVGIGIGPGGAGGPALAMSTGFFGGFSIFGTINAGTGLGAVSAVLPGAGATGVNNPILPPAVIPLVYAYGGSFSSGYNFGLGITNGYGMSATPIGSIIPHIYESDTFLETGPGQAQATGGGPTQNGTTGPGATIDQGAGVPGSQVAPTAPPNAPPQRQTPQAGSSSGSSGSGGGG
jgi:hypothetical protein